MTDNRRYIEKWYARLPGFLHEAERNGFIRDPRQWAVLAHVLADAGENIAVLKYRLAPVLVHSPERQVEFYQLYDLWFSGIEQQEIQAPVTGEIPDQRVPVSVPAVPTLKKNLDPSSGPRWWQWALLFMPLAALLLVAIWYFGALHPITVIVAVLSIGLAIWSTWRWKNRKIEIARQGSSDSGGNFWDFRLPHRRIGLGLEFRRIAARLRERVPGSAYKVNVPRTVRETARRGGFPSVQLQARSEIPSCLMLIDLSNDNNHRASLFDAFYHYLKDWDVPVERYFYRGIPRVLWNDDCPHGIALDTLAANYSHSRIFLLGDAWNLLDARTMRPTALANTFEAWKDRILLTPIPFPQWTARERQLESLFLIAPFTPEGLEVIDRHLNPEEPFDWELQRPDFWSDEAIRFDEAGLPQSLRPYFPDPAMMEWLAALAFYPTLNWSLTIYLGDLLSKRHNRSLLTFDNLRQLSRLHWFYNGFIPEEAREALYSLLDKETAEYIHGHISTLLEAQLKNREDYVSEERNKVYLQILLHKAHAGKASREELRELRRLAKNEQQDFLIARFTRKPKPWDWVLDSDFSFLLPGKQEWNIILRAFRDSAFDWTSAFIKGYRYAVNKTELFSFPRTGNTKPKLESDVQHVEIRENKEKSPELSVTPLRVCISFAPEDKQYASLLMTHLASLVREGLIVIITDEASIPGKIWIKNIKSADIILPLLSFHYLSQTSFGYVRSILRQSERNAYIVPIILNYCEWEPGFEGLQVLPDGGRPILSYSNIDEAYYHTAIGIRRVVEKLRPNISQIPFESSQAPLLTLPQLLRHAKRERQNWESFFLFTATRGTGVSKTEAREYYDKHIKELLGNELYLKNKNKPEAIAQHIDASFKELPTALKTTWLNVLYLFYHDYAFLFTDENGKSPILDNPPEFILLNSGDNVANALKQAFPDVWTIRKEVWTYERWLKSDNMAPPPLFYYENEMEFVETEFPKKELDKIRAAQKSAALEHIEYHFEELKKGLSTIGKDYLSERLAAERDLKFLHEILTGEADRGDFNSYLRYIVSLFNLKAAKKENAGLKKSYENWSGKNEDWLANRVKPDQIGKIDKEFLEPYIFAIDKYRQFLLNDTMGISRYEREVLGLTKTLEITIEKKNIVQKELALAFDPNMKFMLEKQVQQLETDIAGLLEKMAKLEAQRQPAAPTPAAPGTPTPAASGKKIFFSYSKHDRQYLDELLRQLSGLRRQGKIQPWNDLDILPGEEWDATIKHELQTADIILLFLSPDFLNTDYIWDVEITAAMARHEQGTAVVIPVAVRPCDWSGLPFSKLNALPSKAKPVTSYTNRDEAWLEVVQGVKRVV